jgi:c-di-AMP phosphodiesterase-like protein
MPKFLLNRWHGQHVLWGFILLLALIITLCIYEWMIGVIAAVLTTVLVFFTFKAEKAFYRELEEYVKTLTFRVKKAGSEVINKLPIGIVLYNEEQKVEWHNPFISAMLGEESVIGQPVSELFPDLKKLKGPETHFRREGKTYQVLVKEDERLLYFMDVTDYTELLRRYEEEKLALGIVMMDNVEDATKGMDDQTKSIVLAKVIGEITEWANENHLAMTRIAAEKFLLMMNQRSLEHLEMTRFDILDKVRDLQSDPKLPLTLSIGVASGAKDLVELSEWVQTSLDVALSRGGDQAAVKKGQDLVFYGGRTNAVEKRTKVRARVISHALRDMIQDSDKVIVMGHKLPDMDAVGASIGVLKAAQLCGREGYIVLENVNPSIQRLMAEVKKHEDIFKWFITPDEAMNIVTERSLIVVVDTHRASMVANPKLLEVNRRIVVVDHHRRGEEFIKDPILIYLEPYASSTCELITELLQYLQERVVLDAFEATVLLAGMIVDTKSFMHRTGARTFEAASFLRRNGADAALVQNMLKEDLHSYIAKAEIIKHAQILYGHIALVVAEPNRQYPQFVIAQVADTVLNMTGIEASFVICERPDGLIGISARSQGRINVQVIMERLGGGGHFSNAAAQLEGTLAEAEERLKAILQEIEEEEGLLLE